MLKQFEDFNKIENKGTNVNIKIRMNHEENPTFIETLEDVIEEYLNENGIYEFDIDIEIK